MILVGEDRRRSLTSTGVALWRRRAVWIGVGVFVVIMDALALICIALGIRRIIWMRAGV
jgi:hypothetical protein